METIKIGEREVPIHGDAYHSVGGKNHFYQFCQFNGQQRCYGVCAGLVDAYLDRRPWTKEESNNQKSCINAMKRGNCVSLDKRKLERSLNVSIFFKPKVIVDSTIDTSKPVKKNDSYMRGWNQVGSTQKRTEKPVMTYDNAINKAVEKQ